MEPRQGASRARRQGRGGRAGSGRQLRCAPLRARTLAAAGGGRRAGPSHGGFRRPEPRCSFNTGRWMETDERRLVPARGLGLERGWGRHGRGGLRSGLADAAHPGAAPGRAAAALGRAMTARRSAPARGAAQRRRARARVSRTLRERRPQSLGLGETPRSGTSGAAPPAGAHLAGSGAHGPHTRGSARRTGPAPHAQAEARCRSPALRRQLPAQPHVLSARRQASARSRFQSSTVEMSLQCSLTARWNKPRH